MLKENVQAIVFDFDGVLIESLQIKADAFVELFSQYPKHADSIRAYHLANGGISRFAKFRHICENFLHLKLAEDEERLLGERFSSLCYDRVVHCPMVKGAVEALKYCSCRASLFVVSGTPHEEINDIIIARKIDGYFKGVYGSPALKSEHVHQIIKKHGFQPERMVFVGDSIEDYLSASECGMRFVGRTLRGMENQFDSYGVREVVYDMNELIDVIWY